MFDVRDMQLLSALAQHRHFARAAEACGISQPAFSARIRNLEIDLGTQIVNRGNRFLGFTPEGEIALKWARRVLADADQLKQEIDSTKGALSRHLVIGVVPTALTHAAQAHAVLRAKHPGLSLQIMSSSSAEIRKGIEDYSFDAGITYHDLDLPAGATAIPLYQERYVLLSPKAILDSEEMANISWAEAAELPLCLLTKNMRNRQIVDEAFEAVGKVPKAVMETNAFTAALAQVFAGASAIIAPERLIASLPQNDDTVRLQLTEPDIDYTIALVTQDRQPVLPAVAALQDALTQNA
ncbi:MAG: LysR family transcriptional regulator [Pseudomonadota bacterium]